MHTLSTGKGDSVFPRLTTNKPDEVLSHIVQLSNRLILPLPRSKIQLAFFKVSDDNNRGISLSMTSARSRTGLFPNSQGNSTAYIDGIIFPLPNMKCFSLGCLVTDTFSSSLSESRKVSTHSCPATVDVQPQSIIPLLLASQAKVPFSVNNT